MSPDEPGPAASGPASQPASDPASDPAAARSGPPTGADRTREQRRRRLSWWQEGLVLLGLAVVLALVVKTFLVQPFYIPTSSMEPGLQVDDRIVVQKVSYWFGGSPERGDVVVFEDPGGWLSPTEQSGPGNAVTEALAKVGLYPLGGHLVKRVIGVAGDTIECCDRQGRILVNGQPLDEQDYLPAKELECNGPMPGTCDSGGWTAGPVPEGSLFVMGDNRDTSEDSTVHLCSDQVTDCTLDPYVDEDDVVGKVAARIWPADRWDRVERPSTFDDVPDA